MALITAEFFYFLINQAKDERQRLLAWLFFVLMISAAILDIDNGLRIMNNYDNFRMFTKNNLIREELKPIAILWVESGADSPSHIFYLQTLLPYGRVSFIERPSCEINDDQRILLTTQEAADYLLSCPERKLVTRINDWFLIR
jgi:hypothetical protein